MAFAQLIRFDRPLAGARPAAGGPACTEAEAAARCEAAYARGAEAARTEADQRLVELRHDLEQLSGGVLEKLSGLEAALAPRLQAALPGLVLDLARRLLAGFEPPPEVVERLARESLAQAFPERENLELVVCPRDAALLGSLHPEWSARFPGLAIRADAALAPGDCLVHSRFGLMDARGETKLAALAANLSGA